MNSLLVSCSTVVESLSSEFGVYIYCIHAYYFNVLVRYNFVMFMRYLSIMSQEKFLSVICCEERQHPLQLCSGED